MWFDSQSSNIFFHDFYIPLIVFFFILFKKNFKKIFYRLPYQITILWIIISILKSLRLVIYTIEFASEFCVDFACQILPSKVTYKLLESRRNLEIESEFRCKFDSRWPTLLILVLVFLILELCNKVTKFQQSKAVALVAPDWFIVQMY